MLKPTKFNDGVARIYAEKERKTDFGARKNASTVDDLDFVCKLDYQESSRRQEDVDFAEQSGFSLSLKIRTRFTPSVKREHKAVIDGYLYDIRNIDKSGLEMFLYLEGVREIAATGE